MLMCSGYKFQYEQKQTVRRFDPRTIFYDPTDLLIKEISEN